MGNLAGTYSVLGRRSEALVVAESVLEFRRRVLPADHPDIGTAMANLAQTYSTLGKHSDALAMFESVLELRRRVLPADHPDIGEGHVWSAAACVRLLLIVILWFIV